MFVDIIKLFIL